MERAWPEGFHPAAIAGRPFELRVYVPKMFLGVFHKLFTGGFVLVRRWRQSRHWEKKGQEKSRSFVEVSFLSSGKGEGFFPFKEAL